MTALGMKTIILHENGKPTADFAKYVTKNDKGEYVLNRDWSDFTFIYNNRVTDSKAYRENPFPPNVQVNGVNAISMTTFYDN